MMLMKFALSKRLKCFCALRQSNDASRAIWLQFLGPKRSILRIFLLDPAPRDRLSSASASFSWQFVSILTEIIIPNFGGFLKRVFVKVSWLNKTWLFWSIVKVSIGGNKFLNWMVLIAEHMLFWAASYSREQGAHRQLLHACCLYHKATVAFNRNRCFVQLEVLQ